MIRSSWRSRLTAALFVATVCVTGSVAASERPLKATTHNYPKTPVELQRATAALVEVFATPTQYWTPDAKTKGTRIRYANRAGLSPSTFVLQGEVSCTNKSTQPVEAIALAIVALDAFHQPIHALTSQQSYAVQQIIVSLPKGATKRIKWEQLVRVEDIYEVAVIATRVRFANDAIWTAPNEELIDIF
ncbi:MAG: hypothetical protein HY352_01640 [Candidatus Omnitrophica bacterium]|nr:hypothetical protein [Candidatus Omnitrophota bacterium]